MQEKVEQYRLNGEKELIDILAANKTINKTEAQAYKQQAIDSIKEQLAKESLPLTKEVISELTFGIERAFHQICKKHSIPRINSLNQEEQTAMDHFIQNINDNSKEWRG